jgi:Mg-chelatase subunit ChlD
MVDTRVWAHRRRLTILTGIGIVLMLLLVSAYFRYIYIPPDCFDGRKNGNERGEDCGGECMRICTFDTQAPEVVWVQSFRVVPGQYNAVAYVRNPNRTAGTPALPYTIRLEDENGIIAERSGTTVFVPDSVTPIFEGRIMTERRVPTRTTITFGDAALWLPGNTTNQQFSVIDRGAIVNADAAPRLESRVRNNGLIPMSDVEVVTTIFNAAGQPVTASRTFTDFAPQGNANVIFTWPEPIATTVRSCEVPTDVILAIDLSGSMNNLGGVPPEPLAAVKKAAQSFVDRLGQNDRVGVVTFATNGAFVAPLTTNFGDVSTRIAGLDIAPEEEAGSTNSGSGLALALEEFASPRHNPNARKVLVLLTDGRTNEPAPAPEQFALDIAARLEAAQTKIFTIGIGEDLNTAFLQDMATDPTTFYTTVSPAQVDRIYRTITEAICEVGPARVDIIPKTNRVFPTWPN